MYQVRISTEGISAVQRQLYVLLVALEHAGAGTPAGVPQRVQGVAQKVLLSFLEIGDCCVLVLTDSTVLLRVTYWWAEH
jgi:hypothetical protein